MARTRQLEKGEMDRLIGRRIRRRRITLNMTQAALAGCLGVSFQQVQRYEKGMAQISKDRLKEIAHFLGVSPGYFRVKLDVPSGVADQLEQFVESEEGLKLFGAFAQIDDPQMRSRLVTAIEAISESHLQRGKPQIVAASPWLQRLSSEDGASDSAQEAAGAIQAMKIELARLVGQTIKSRKMSQAYTAQILSTDQGRVSVVARGLVRAISFEMLLRYLLLLGWDVSVSVKERPIERKAVVETDMGAQDHQG
jgi:transcriptional regulator with XRE-family HTH domain